MLRLYRFATLVCAASLLAMASSPVESDGSAMAKARTAIAQLPLHFEANLGQMNSEIRYAARSGGFQFLLTGRGPSLRLSGAGQVDVRFLNSNLSPRIEPLERAAARVDSFIGSRAQWRTNIPAYSRVRYRSVYDGVDVEYYGNQGRLEYDLVLSPGAEPRDIRIQFTGPVTLSLNPSGDLVLKIKDQRLVQKRPFIYQEDPVTHARLEIAGGYRLLPNHTVSLRVGSYDRKRRLIIDPVLTYLTYWGGSGTDQINAAKLDSRGRLYLAGQTDKGEIPYQDGAYRTGNSGLTDIFLSVFDTSNGSYTLVYSSFLGGSSDDVPLAIDVDPAGAAYLTGYTKSTDFPMVGATQTSPATNFLNAFAAKIDPSQYGDGSLVFSSYLTGTDGDSVGKGVAAGKDGRIYLIGTTKAGDFPVTTSAFQSVRWGDQDAFVAKIDPSTGGIDYATYLGGEDLDDGRNILVDANGLVYFAVSTLSTEFPMAGLQFNAHSSGGADVAVGVMDLNQSGSSSLRYSTYFGGSGNEEVRAMAFTGKGGVIFTGYTLSQDLPLTADAVQRVNNGGGDAFAAILDPSRPFQGGLIYSTYLGGQGGDVAYGVTVDANGDIYLTGYTLSSDFPIAGNVPQSSWGGGTDVFVTKFKTGVAGLGAIAFSTYLGSTNLYVPVSVNVGPDGRIYVAGHGGIGLPSSQIAIQGGYAGGNSDGFFFVLTPDSPSRAPQQTQNPLPAAARRHSAPRATMVPHR